MSDWSSLKNSHNPHPDFKKVENARENWQDVDVRWTKTAKPDWQFGDGANDNSWKDQEYVSIDPSQDERSSRDNYKLLISGIVPRPVGFISTISEDGKSKNLAPMSYTQVVHHDPPLLIVGFASSKDDPAKDTLRNIIATKELTINIISEWFIEAANATSIDAPYGTSEWAVSGLTPAKSEKVRCPWVNESAFAIEAKLEQIIPFHNREGVNNGTMIIVEGVHFHVRRDVINEELNDIDICKLRPIARLGGITYGRITQTFEIPRPQYDKEKDKLDEKGLLRRE